MAAIGTGSWTPNLTITGQYLLKALTSVNLQASHTIMARVKHGLTTTTYSSFVVGYSAQAVTSSFSGSLVGRRNGQTGTALSCWRQNDASTPTVDQALAASSYGNTSTWYHITLAYDASTGTIRTYVDGVASATQASVTTRAKSSTANNITAALHNGKLADLAYFNRLLTPTEIADMASYRVPQVTSGLVLFWRLDSETGTVTADSSGNGNNGTRTGSAPNITYSTADNPPQPELPIVEGDVTFTSGSTFELTPTAIDNGASTLLSGTTLALTANTLKPAAETLLSGTTIVAGGSARINAAVTLLSGTSVLPTANTTKPAAVTLLSATTLALTPTATKPGAATLLSGTTVDAAGSALKTGSATLVSGTTLALTPTVAIPAAASLLTGTTLALDPTALVSASATLQTATALQISFTAARRYTNYDNVNASSWSLNAAQPFSICGWIYLVQNNSGGAGDLFYTELSGVESIWLGYQNSSGSELVWSVNGSQHTESVATGAWHHMALTNDGADVRCYLDGVEVYSVASTLSATYDHADLGDFAFGTSIVEIGQVKVWGNYALSPSELASEIAFWTPQTATANVVAWWQLTTSLPDDDSSGNGHDLSGPGAAGEHTVPGQLAPLAGAVTLLSGSTVLPTANTLKPAAATLSSGTTVLPGGTTVLRAASTLVSGTTVLAGGVTQLSAAVTLTTGTALTVAAAQQQPAAATLTTGTAIIAASSGTAGATLVTGTTVTLTALVLKPGAVTLLSGTTVVAGASTLKPGAATLTTSTTVQPTANTLKPAAATLLSGTHVDATAAVQSFGATTLASGTTVVAAGALIQSGAVTISTGTAVIGFFPVVPVVPSGWYDADGGAGATHTPWQNRGETSGASHSQWKDEAPLTAAGTHSPWIAAA